VKRATSASVRRVRIGRLSKFFESSCSFLKRRRSRASICTIVASWSIVFSSVSVSFDGVISSVYAE